MTSQIKSHYEGVFTNLDKVDRVVVLTERQAGEMRQRFENVPLKVIPHYARHASAAMPKQKFSGQVVYVARYAPEKNHAAAIRAFALAVRRFPDLVFHCYGGGDPEKLRLSEISREAGVEDAVRFHDFKENVLEIYEQADLAILTSREEGFSLVVQEALSQGVPVVSFDIRYGPGDMIQDGYNGFLVPEGDEAALAGRVCEVFSNPTLHKTLSENAIRSINNRFSRAKVAPLWSSLLLGEG